MTVLGMLYSTQFHLVPSRDSVVINSANDFVSLGALDQDSGGVDRAPSQVKAAGRVPPSVTAVLVSVKLPVVLEMSVIVVVVVVEVVVLTGVVTVFVVPAELDVPPPQAASNMASSGNVLNRLVSCIAAPGAGLEWRQKSPTS